MCAVSLASTVPEEGCLSCCESSSCSSLHTQPSSICFSRELVRGVTCFALPQPVVCAEAAGTQNPVPSGEGSSPCSHSEYTNPHTKLSLGNSLAGRTAEQTGWLSSLSLRCQCLSLSLRCLSNFPLHRNTGTGHSVGVTAAVPPHAALLRFRWSAALAV